LITDSISSGNLDIFYNESVKKWSRYNKRKDTSFGLCFQGFLELFITLARLYFPSNNFEESLKSMIFYTLKLLKPNGLNEQDYCILSCNGPINHVNEIVKLKLQQIIDVKKQDVKTDPKYHNYELINFKRAKTSTNSITCNNSRSTSLTAKSKRTLFPIFF
jgi:hypothetical protein